MSAATVRCRRDEIKVFEKEEKTILVEKSAAATAVAEIMDEETAYPVIDGLFHTRIKIE